MKKNALGAEIAQRLVRFKQITNLKRICQILKPSTNYMLRPIQMLMPLRKKGFPHVKQPAQRG